MRWRLSYDLYDRTTFWVGRRMPGARAPPRVAVGEPESRATCARPVRDMAWIALPAPFLGPKLRVFRL